MIVNGKVILFYGVNRYEYYFLFGCVVFMEFVKCDFILMKEYNINVLCIFYQLNNLKLFGFCDEFGFYVIDEVDFECYGFFVVVL